MIVREEETLRKTAVLQIVCEELFIRSIGSVFNALLFCFGQRKGENLNTSVASSPYFNMFLVAQVKAHDKGFLSMEIDIESMLENRGDIHHLFPKNYLIKNGIVQAQYNQIANYAFIQQEINIKIKDSSPAHYMTEVIGQCNTKKPVYGGIIEQDRLAENLKQNCIPDGFESMEIGDYQDFLQRRRELMAEKIHQYYDSL